MTPISTPSQDALSKTSTHIFNDLNLILKTTSDEVNNAKNIGSNRSKGYASAVIIIVSILIQGFGSFGIESFQPKKQKSESSVTVVSQSLSPVEQRLIISNLERINSNAEVITNTKTRVAPSMQIDQNINSIKTSAEDIKAIVDN